MRKNEIIYDKNLTSSQTFHTEDTVNIQLVSSLIQAVWEGEKPEEKKLKGNDK